jgi:hypothetical protein
MRWKFTAEADVAAYGDRWWTWDEVALTRLRGRQLIEIEETLGRRFVDLIERVHDKSMWGQFAALWVSMHVAGHPVEWAEFDPIVLTTVWEAVPDETPLDSGEDQPTPESSSSPEPATESATS